MARSQRLSKRKVSGTKYIRWRKKTLEELGGIPTMTKLAPLKKKTDRGVGGNTKERVMSSDIVNLKSKDNKCKVVKIKNVTESPSNKNFVRRNIITKGTIIETEAGKAKVTNRPGQEGTINAVLLE